ncbi:SDR family oxidoreductase [Kribbella pratensis]|uniref:SDR family oxidoreductase n=1 Tax=Kribbella pratensis TaxID=2512112 RepID=UPI001EE0CB8A|nr:NAD(P)H-binding protein [Kribbella pratensis]
MTTVLVTGATGRVGRHVVAGLRAAGVTVRALVRTPDLAGFPPEIELIQGDITDVAAVRRAAAGVDAAFLLWPSFSADGASQIVRRCLRESCICLRSAPPRVGCGVMSSSCCAMPTRRGRSCARAGSR